MKALFYLVAKLYEAVLVRSSRLESGELRYGGNLLELAQEILGDSGTARLCVECLLESQLVKLMIDSNFLAATLERPHPTPELTKEQQVFRVLMEEYQLGKEVSDIVGNASEKVLAAMKQLALAKRDGWVPSKEITRALLPDFPVAERKHALHLLVKKCVLRIEGTRAHAKYRLVEVAVAPPKAPEIPSSDEELLVQLAEGIQKLDEDIAELQKMLGESQQKRDELGKLRDDLRKLAETRQRARELLAG